ncbi:hypothetical protein ACRALDRAFT_212370 [Sodiomyces alcalophilus JCM 7366]|uniref:uncharacterized protein n=1 Tax=Sodiomyces alcalophilus JCM 7366 TaxID=591952 RepID=UPI0039B5D7E1
MCLPFALLYMTRRQPGKATLFRLEYKYIMSRLSIPILFRVQGETTANWKEPEMERLRGLDSKCRLGVNNDEWDRSKLNRTAHGRQVSPTLIVQRSPEREEQSPKTNPRSTEYATPTHSNNRPNTSYRTKSRLSEATGWRKEPDRRQRNAMQS